MAATLYRFGVASIAAGALLLAAPAAHSQQYPTRIIRIVTAAAGGGSDFIARVLAQGLSGPLGQQIIVDNRGTGVLAGEVAAKAPPDGYTLTVQGGAFWLNPLLRKTAYDPINDFSPVSLVDREVNVLAVNPSLPIRSVKDLIDYAKAHPGKLNYSSPGVGSTTHLASELFRSMAGINIVHVPYQGNQPAISATMGNEVQMVIVDAGLVAPQAKAGKLRALAVTSLGPSELAPGLPTIAESGLPGYESIGMTGLFAVGKKVDRTIVTRLNEEVRRFLDKPEIKAQFLKSGVEIVGSSPEEFATAIKQDIAKTSKLIKEIDLKVE